MKTVFSSQEALNHAWANQTQDYGRANSMYFQNGVLFSYSTAIAELCESISGEKIALMNDCSYSNSTCKHQSYSRRALNGAQKVISGLHYLNAKYSLKAQDQSRFNEIAQYNEERAAELLVKASRARTRGDLFKGQAYDILKAINEYAESFGFEYNFKTDLNELQESATAAADQARKQEAAARKARIEKQAEDLQAWREGGGYSGNFAQTALRINQADQTIETTHRATIPLSQAATIWRLVYAIHKKGAPVYGLGFTVGNYTLNTYKNGVFSIGCHGIGFDEFAQLAIQLGHITAEQLSQDLSLKIAA